MSADLLREAAAEIRREQDVAARLGHIYDREHACWLVVADWLIEMADKGDRNIRPDWYLHNWGSALAVARAYLGTAT